AETSLKLVNAILKEPARTDTEFRKKLGGLFRELHSIKGEASALSLSSIAARVHTLEDMVAECKKKAELSGGDFLPLVLKLDELLAHLRGVREMATRLTDMKESMPAGAARGAARERPAARVVEDLSPVLHSLAERLAHDHAKRFRLALAGLTEVPASYAATVKDCLIQMLRNAAVHGIEAPDVRRAQTKQEIGVVSVHFRKAGDGYELTFEDDGAGIATEELKAAAVRKQLISAADARAMDNRAAMALIFRPGFSTEEDVSLDAGRGVGKDVVARSVYALGGKIAVSTHPGRFTRFKILLPPAQAVSTAVA
ncbi:MAG TPA: ATP-binding protein, partial [Candidatus Dormibacteraeota bacterium]|nr:ATP-binding protein [Candidatus Dormibacteraeota bacterium]